MDALDNSQTIWREMMLGQDEQVARQAFDAVSGEIYASTRTALIEDSRFVRQVANDHLRAAFAPLGAPLGASVSEPESSASASAPVAWAKGFGSWGSTDSDGNAATLDRSTGGLLLGADRKLGNWRVGVLGGYSHSSFKAGDRDSSGRSDNYHLGLYGGTQWERLGLRTGLGYTWHDIKTKRVVSIPGLTASLKGSYRAGTFQAFGELAYGVDAGADIRFELFANLAHVSLHSQSFKENGGPAALSGRSGNTDVTLFTLGLRGEYAITSGAMNARLTGMVGWRHAFGGTTPQCVHAFSAGLAFTIARAPIAKSSAVLEAGLELNVTDKVTVGLSYVGQLAESAKDQV